MKKDEPSATYVVLSGDLIGSRALSSDALNEVMTRFNDGVIDFVASHSLLTLHGPDFFRGDSWQLILNEIGLSLRLSLYIRAWLISESGIDTRVSLGIGGVDNLVPGHVSLSTGSAFEVSGHGLDQLKSPYYMSLTFAEQSPCLPVRESGLIIQMLDRIVRGWSQREAFAVAHAILGDSQEETAAASPVNPRTGRKPSRQAVSDALRRADWKLIESVLDWFFSQIKASDLACN